MRDCGSRGPGSNPGPDPGDTMRIEVDPRKMGGKPVIKGTRITVERILELLEEGYTPKEIAEELGITVEDVRAAVEYARHLVAGEEVVGIAEVTY